LFERFTERARQAVVLGQEEAEALRHDYVGTEHLLLGILREREGVGAHVLEGFDVTLERVRGEVVRIVGVGQSTAPAAGHLPFEPAAKKALELALREAGKLGHTYIGTEHILLGLVSAKDGRSGQILRDLKVDPNRIRDELIRVSASVAPDVPPELSPPGEAAPSGSGFDEWVRVGPGSGVRRLLTVAAAHTLYDGRSGIEPRDVLLALTRDKEIGPVLADLGVDEPAVLRALERRRPPEAPPRASSGT
jgi:ATP-dependent Clp protease ATP-binding subunit ClpC